MSEKHQNFMPSVHGYPNGSYQYAPNPGNQLAPPPNPPPYVDPEQVAVTITPVEPRVSQQTVTTEVTRRYETTDCCQSTVPRLPRPLALTFCIMSCIIPGWGAIGASFASCCYKQYDYYGDGDDEENGHRRSCCGHCGGFCGTFCFGFLQFLCAPIFLLGWVWSVQWGLQLLRASERGSLKTTTTTTTTCAASAATAVSSSRVPAAAAAAAGTAVAGQPGTHASQYPTAHLSVTEQR